MCGSSYQDINLKIAKNSQALHFQFREDKQWKLQQVTVAPCEKSRNEDGSGGLECLIQVFLTCVFITAVHIKTAPLTASALHTVAPQFNYFSLLRSYKAIHIFA